MNWQTVYDRILDIAGNEKTPVHGREQLHGLRRAVLSYLQNEDDSEYHFPMELIKVTI